MTKKELDKYLDSLPLEGQRFLYLMSGVLGIFGPSAGITIFFGVDAYRATLAVFIIWCLFWYARMEVWKRDKEKFDTITAEKVRDACNSADRILEILEAKKD